MVCGVAESSGTSGSYGERSSARVPDTSLAENKTAMSPNKKWQITKKGKIEMKQVGLKIDRCK